MEAEKYDDLWSDHVPTDILKSISSRLVAGDYFVFRAVCKAWREHPLPPQLHLHHDDQDDTPSIVEFFNPVYNALIIPTMVISKLKGSRIRSSKANWLLMSHGNRGMFFFNPKSNDIIELPNLPLIHNCFSAWTFSCPPNSSSSSCFVVGFDEVGSPPDVYIIKVGDTTWTYHYFVNELRNCQGLFSLLGYKGTLGVLTINENSAAETPSWQFYGTPFSRTKQKSIREVYMVEDVDNRGMLAVFLTHEQGKIEVWRYNMNGRIFERKQITNLDNNKTLFVSFGGSYLKPCVARGLENKIYLPMYHNKDKGVFYCLATHRYYSFDYSFKKPLSSPNYYNLSRPRCCIWIER
ncbi:hypothetical protein R3W88_023854 [Solanum pinnatisectum]|uniref:F-box domain-containing protein n=1 Tax=Solanum pinnatisectum TaxID=50273 RepID=A0AAV9LYW0_9SOLN|nr:hypothetical protein R3W88_023854 [Solanum pinnatisectum]